MKVHSTLDTEKESLEFNTHTHCARGESCGDTTAPEMIQLPGLNCLGIDAAATAIKIRCTWTTPNDLDFNASVVHFGTDLPQDILGIKDTQSLYEKTVGQGLYEIKVYTNDTTGNVNNTIVAGRNKRSCQASKLGGPQALLSITCVN